MLRERRARLVARRCLARAAGACLLAATAVLSACLRHEPHGHPVGSRVDASAASSPIARVAAPAKTATPASRRIAAVGCNVVVISIDSLRADMPWNGYSRPIAPRLTDLEKRATDFTHAYAISSYTAMSLGGFLGGRLPSELSRSGYFFGTYRNDTFFPRVLQKAGVRTMALMAHGYFRSAGFDRGFDDWRIVPGITFDPNTDRDITSPQSERISEQMLGDAANDNGRFFFWVHFLDPHDLYMHHEDIDWGRKDRDRYDGEVTFTDRYVGKLLDFIGTKSWGSRTVVIVTADHGEEFGEHHMARHGFEIWETLVRVPLLIVAPGAPPRRIDLARSAIDLAPTILDFFGIAPDAAFEGRSLVDEVYGGPTEPRDVVVDLPMTSDSGRRRALIHGSYKLMCFDNDTYCKLFALDSDPMEQSPVTKGEQYQEMVTRYRAIRRQIKEVPPYACGVGCLNGAYRKETD
jgi:arylsulfatase A-like enzyme